MTIRTKIALFFCGLLMISLIYSPFLLSVSMISLLLLGLTEFNEREGKKSFGFNKKVIVNLSDWKHHLSFLVIPFYILIVLLSFWQTEGDWNAYLVRLRIKLPFLVLPIAFLGLPKFTKPQVNGLLYFLLLILTITSIGIGINYLLHYEEINNLLSKGKPMPTPRNHIRYSLLMSTGIIAGIYLIVQKYCWKNKKERFLIIGFTLFLFLFIHVLSVKSGILCLYVALGVLSLRYIYVTRKFFLGFAFLLGLVCLPVIAFQTIPSFRQKLTYMHFDYLRYMSGEGEQYSDAGRLTSIKAGLEIFQSAPIFGVGAGNLEKEINQLYARKYPDYVKPIMPHNQFLFVLAGTGIFGFFFFTIAFFLPLFYKKAYRNIFFLGFYMIFLTAFMLEHTIENALGVGTFIFFLLLLLNMTLLKSTEDIV